MNLLLDSHALLWALLEPNRLPATLRHQLRNPANSVHASAVSFWEISLEAGLGKLSLGTVRSHGLKLIWG